MLFDPGLAQRVREVVGDRPGVTERKMFGGIAFLVDGPSALELRVGANKSA